MNEFPEIAVLWNVRAGVEPALDSFGILSASVYVKSPISEGRQLSVLPIEHTAHHALIIGSVRKTNVAVIALPSEDPFAAGCIFPGIEPDLPTYATRYNG